MTIRTFDKNGDISNCFRYVKNIKLMFISGCGSRGLLNLNMSFKDGSELDYYLSEDENFATMTETINE